MKYTFQLELISGKNQGMTGDIHGTLEEDVPYPSQSKMIEKQIDAFAGWLKVSRSEIAPGKEKLFSQLVYWEEFRDTVKSNSIINRSSESSALEQLDLFT